MIDFTLKAPTLYEPEATSESSATVYSDASGAGKALAQRKRFAQWLKAELVKQGVAAEGPTDDEGAWLITVPAAKKRFDLFVPKQRGFVLIMVSIEGDRNKEDTLYVSVSPIGSVVEQSKRVEQILEKILHESDLISELNVLH